MVGTDLGRFFRCCVGDRVGLWGVSDFWDCGPTGRGLEVRRGCRPPAGRGDRLLRRVVLSLPPDGLGLLGTVLLPRSPTEDRRTPPLAPPPPGLRGGSGGGRGASGWCVGSLWFLWWLRELRGTLVPLCGTPLLLLLVV